MIASKGFIYTSAALGHPAFAPVNRLGQQVTVTPPPSPAGAPAVVVQQTPSSAPAASDGVSLLGVLIVGGAILVGLEVAGVTHVLGLDKLAKKLY